MINTIETGVGIGLFPIIGIRIDIGFKIEMIILDFVVPIWMGMYEVKPEHKLCQQSMPLKGIDTHWMKMTFLFGK